MAKTICFLVRGNAEFNVPENLVLLSQAALNAGYKVKLALIDGLAMQDAIISAPQTRLTEPLAPEQPYAGFTFKREALNGLDYVWLLSMGARETFLDKMQILEVLNASAPVINSPHALMHVRSKYHLLGLPHLIKHPHTHVSNDAALLRRLAGQSDTPWVLKAAAESFGNQVFLLKPGDADALANIDALTAGGRYAILQRFLPEIKNGEKRVLLAGGKIVGQYLRKNDTDVRTNLHQGAEASACELTADETILCEKLGAWLVQQGAYFTGIDLVYPYVLECNVASPGGLGTLLRLTGVNYADKVIGNVIGALT